MITPLINNVTKLVKRSARAGIIGSILLILLATLSPFNFSFDNFSIQYILSNFYYPSSPVDVIANILLFVPFGFGFASQIQQTKLKTALAIIAVLVVSFGLSLTVEVLQVFLPARASTPMDIVTNSMGGVLGCLLFYRWRLEVINQSSVLIQIIRGCFSIQKLTVSLMGYVIFVCLILIALQNATNLRNWDETFPLLLGNELTVQRPWEGKIYQVCIAEKVASEVEVAQLFSRQGVCDAIAHSLIASYLLTGRENYPDRTGQLPDLIWQAKSLKNQEEMGVVINSHQWLQTKEPPALMTQKLRDTSQFTLSMTLATDDVKQTGPARIFSLSKDAFHRNFTVGQLGTSLNVRLRTPLTGANGKRPEFIVPNVFTDTKLHHLVLTYDGLLLHIYVDQVENVYGIKLIPKTTLVLLLSNLFDGQINLKRFDPGWYNFLCSIIIFVPLGIIVGLISSISKGKLTFYLLLMGGGIIVPAMIIESLLVSASGGGIQPAQLLLGMAIATSTMLLVKKQNLEMINVQNN